jgi:hypothetical protein
MRVFLVVVFLFFISILGYSQEIKFKKILGSYSFDFGYSVKQTLDSGYILCGNSGFTGITQAYVLRTDSLGNLLWEKTFGEGEITLAHSIIETSDSCFAFCGYQLGESNDYDVCLYKIDRDGNFKWKNKYGGNDWDFSYSLVQAIDSGFVLTGSTNSHSNGNQVYIIKTDKLGVLEWENNFGGEYDDEARFIDKCEDGGYILCGTTKSFGDITGDIYVLKINSLGNLEWSKSYGNSNGNDYGTCIKEISTGEFVLTGAFFYTQENHHLACFMKITNIGDTIYTKLKGSPNEAVAYSVVESNDGGYVWLGKLNLGGAYKAYLYKIDTYGAFTFAYAYGDSYGSDIGFEVNKTNDNGFVCIGTTKRPQNNFTEDIYFFKTDSSGLAPENSIFTPTILSEREIVSESVVFPNPTKDFFLIEVDNDCCFMGSSFSELNGRLIDFEVSLELKNTSKTIYKVKPNNLSPGIYFFKYFHSGLPVCKKIIIE